VAEQPTTFTPPSGALEAGRSLLDAVRRYWWFTGLIVLVALAATFAITKQQTETYQASARVLLRTNATADLFPLASSGPEDLLRNPDIEQFYTQSTEYISTVQDETPDGVQVSARATENELVFTARGAEPEEVAEAANLWAQGYIDARHADVVAENDEGIAFAESTILELEAERSDLRSEIDALEDLIDETTDSDQISRLLAQQVVLEQTLQPQLAPIDQQIADFRRQLGNFNLLVRFLDEPEAAARLTGEAGVPSSPVSPNLVRNLLVGGLLGLGLGVALPYLRYSLVDRISGSSGISHATGLPVLSSVPNFAHESDQSVEVLDHPSSPASEHYQGLMTAIDFASIAEPIQSIFFTSAAPGDGKTTTAVNVAALASKYMNVILIDADMRRPSVHHIVDRPNFRGLSDVLAGTTSWSDARQTFERNGATFDVLTAGSAVKDPALMLRGGAWRDLIEDLFLYDLVVIDGPPVLAVTDALLIGRAADAQVLLVRSERTSRRDLVEAAGLLAGNGSRSIGVVLNREDTGKGSYQYYGTYKSEDSEPVRVG